jgi:hypothetical protein
MILLSSIFLGCSLALFVPCFSHQCEFEALSTKTRLRLSQPLRSRQDLQGIKRQDMGVHEAMVSVNARRSMWSTCECWQRCCRSLGAAQIAGRNSKPSTASRAPGERAMRMLLREQFVASLTASRILRSMIPLVSVPQGCGHVALRERCPIVTSLSGRS